MQTTKPETAQQRPTGARMALLMLLYFIKIGAFTFGSGWSIIAQMEREFVDERKTPTDRLVARLGLSAYYGLHAHTCIPLEPETVFIPFQQHIGKPAVPVKAVGDPVAKGELLAQAAPDGLSANIHASIDGVVTEITPAGARLCRKEV